MHIRLLNVSRDRLKIIDQGQIIFDAASKVSHHTTSGKKSNAWVVEQILDQFLPMRKEIEELRNRNLELMQKLDKETTFRRNVRNLVVATIKTHEKDLETFQRILHVHDQRTQVKKPAKKKAVKKRPTKKKATRPIKKSVKSKRKK